MGRWKKRAMFLSIAASAALAGTTVQAEDLDLRVAQVEVAPDDLGQSEEIPGDIDSDEPSATPAAEDAAVDSNEEPVEASTDEEGTDDMPVEATAEDDGSEPEVDTMETEAEAPVAEPPAAETTDDSSYAGRPDAPSLTTDELWDAYVQAQGRFEGFLTEAEHLDPETTTGSRVYAESIGTGFELRDLLTELVSREDELSDEELTIGTDSLLTIEQVIGSLLVEVGECEHGRQMLQELKEDERVTSRPVLLQSVERWYNNAVRCVERQRVEAEVAAARQEGHEAEIARLEAELAEAKTAEEEAETAAEAPLNEDDPDSILLSRSELMEILRQSQSERDAYYGQQYQAYVPPEREGPKREFGFAVFGAPIGVPDFSLDIFFDEHASTWSDGANFNVGATFYVRKFRTVQHGFSFTYADLSTEDHWWVTKNKERGDAKWVENGLRPLGLTYEYQAIAPLGNRQRFQLYFAVDFGINIIPSGQWKQREVFDAPSGACFDSEEQAQADSGGLDRFRAGGDCGPDAVENNPDGVFGDNEVDDSVIFPVLPSLGLGFGARYMISDIVGIGIEIGYRDLYAYAGGALEFVFASQE